MIKDITTHEDIELLVNTFYKQILESENLAPIFNTVANVNWDKHLPIMYNFWSSILLGSKTYSGNPMEVHVELSKLKTLTPELFSEWLYIFTTTVNKLFKGSKADEAIQRAANIARLMEYKVSQQNT